MRATCVVDVLLTERIAVEAANRRSEGKRNSTIPDNGKQIITGKSAAVFALVSKK